VRTGKGRGPQDACRAETPAVRRRAWIHLSRLVHLCFPAQEPVSFAPPATWQQSARSDCVEGGNACEIRRSSIEETLFRPFSDSPLFAPLKKAEAVPDLPAPSPKKAEKRREFNLTFHESCVMGDTGIELRDVSSEPHSHRALSFHALVTAEVSRILDVPREGIIFEAIDEWEEQYTAILLSFSQVHLQAPSLDVIRQLVLQVYNRNGSELAGGALQRAEDAAIILSESSRPKIRIYLRELLQEIVGADFCSNNPSATSSQRSLVAHSSALAASEHTKRPHPLHQSDAGLNGSLEYANPDPFIPKLSMDLSRLPPGPLDLQLFDSDDDDWDAPEIAEGRAENRFSTPQMQSWGDLLDHYEGSIEEEAMFWDVLQTCEDGPPAMNAAEIWASSSGCGLRNSELSAYIGTPNSKLACLREEESDMNALSPSNCDQTGSFSKTYSNVTHAVAPRVLAVSPVVTCSSSPALFDDSTRVKPRSPRPAIPSVDDVVLSLQIERERQEQERAREKEEQLVEAMARQMEQSRQKRNIDWNVNVSNVRRTPEVSHSHIFTQRGFHEDRFHSSSTCMTTDYTRYNEFSGISRLTYNDEVPPMFTYSDEAANSGMTRNVLGSRADAKSRIAQPSSLMNDTSCFAIYSVTRGADSLARARTMSHDDPKMIEGDGRGGRLHTYTSSEFDNGRSFESGQHAYEPQAGDMLCGGANEVRADRETMRDVLRSSALQRAVLRQLHEELSEKP